MTSPTTLTLHTADGQALAADLAEPAGDRLGAVVVCHPHPQYGGDRFHPIVDELFRRLPAAGFRTIRFNFRAAHDGGTAERLDVVAALDEVTADALDAPAFVVGYSFGALVALATEDGQIAGVVAIAPPLAPAAPAPGVPALVLTPRHDQFCPPERAEPIVGAWPGAAFEVVESADHFLVGAAAEVGRRTVSWLEAATTS